jgi:hypothetical protein
MFVTILKMYTAESWFNLYTFNYLNYINKDNCYIFWERVTKSGIGLYTS